VGKAVGYRRSYFWDLLEVLFVGPLLFRVNQICIAGDGLLEMVQLCKQGVSGKQAIASKYGRDIRCFEAAGRAWGGGNRIEKAWFKSGGCSIVTGDEDAMQFVVHNLCGYKYPTTPTPGAADERQDLRQEACHPPFEGQPDHVDAEECMGLASNFKKICELTGLTVAACCSWPRLFIAPGLRAVSPAR